MTQIFPTHRVGIRTCSDYSPFGVELDGRTVSGGYRYGFNGKEKTDEISGEGNSYDFGARMYNSLLGRWLKVDRFSNDYPHQSNYIYSSNSTIYKIDTDGDWDITVHAYTDRGKMGYGIAVLTNNAGEVIGQYLVRTVGSAGNSARKSGKIDANLRTITNGDTPTGVYDIGIWMSPTKSEIAAFGNNKRLQLTGIEGEIMDCSTDRQTTIRLHGGRQERGITGNFDPDNILKMTNGCSRIADDDILEIYNLTQELEKNDPNESSGKLTVIDDLVQFNNEFYLPVQAEAVSAAYYYKKWADKRIKDGHKLNFKQATKYSKSHFILATENSVNDRIESLKEKSE